MATALFGIEGILVLLILLGALILFVTEALRAELVALSVMALLMLTGLVSPEEGVSGFSNPATMTILALFIISAGVYKTGIVTFLARRLALLTGASEVRILLVLVLVVGPVSAFINNTAAVAILLPLVMTLAKESRLSASKLLIPLSYVSMLAGTLTLVGTSTNILASNLYLREYGRPFGMFEFSIIGAVIFTTGCLYLFIIGRHLIPARVAPGEASEDAFLRQFLTEVRIRPGSPMVGKSLVDHKTRERYRIDVIRILRGQKAFDQPLAEIPLEAGDILVLRAGKESITRLEGEAKVEILAGVKQEDIAAGTTSHVVEVVVSPSSTLMRRSLNESAFAQEFGVKVLGLRKHGPGFFRRLASTRLDFGDTLLVLANPESLERLREDPSFIVSEEAPFEHYRTDKIIVGLGITATVITLAAMGVFPILVAAMAGAVLMVLSGVLRADELWTSIRWDVIFLLAGLIPLGIALENTGVASTVGAGIAVLAQNLPALGIIMAFYLASMLLTEMISNNATVILLVPISFATAAALGVSAIPLVLAVMFAASAAFMTPIGYQTNLMVYGPGEYKFTDFTRVGAPLNFLLWIVTSYAISVFFPL